VRAFFHLPYSEKKTGKSQLQTAEAFRFPPPAPALYSAVMRNKPRGAVYMIILQINKKPLKNDFSLHLRQKIIEHNNNIH